MPEDAEDANINFPKDFLWGASVSAYQVEGGNHNQWTVWELAHAAEQAKTAEKRYGHLPHWDEIKKQAKDPNNYVSGRGIDHYNLYEDDFKLLKKLNLNTFRFGVEWSRLEPEEGQWNQEAIEHYRGYIEKLKDMDIEPVINLWHWTSPVWFAEKGGFDKGSNLKYFDRFVKKISDEYGHMLRYVITLNEPNNYITFGYLLGTWPPGEKNFIRAFRNYWNLVEAHRRAYKILKLHHPEMQVGIAAQLLGQNLFALEGTGALGQACRHLRRFRRSGLESRCFPWQRQVHYRPVHRPIGQQQQPLDHVAQFPNVARPGIALQLLIACGAKVCGFQPFCSATWRGEVRHQRRDLVDRARAAAAAAAGRRRCGGTGPRGTRPS